MATKTYIVLLRGVMPSGKNKVPMSRLREVLVEGGFQNVRTYIQSGNVLVDTESSPREIEQQVHALLKKNIGPDLVVVVRTGPEIQEILDSNPFKKRYDISRQFFVLFASTPSREKVAELLSTEFGDEKLFIKDAGYMYIPGTYGRGKLSSNFLEKKLGVPATMRNYNTLTKLLAMSAHYN